MLDKSKKVGRFRRRDRGVSHVFAIFFCRTNFSAISSFTRFLSRARVVSLPLNIHRRVIIRADLPPIRVYFHRRRQNERKRNRRAFVLVGEESRSENRTNTFDLSSTTDRFERIRFRYVEWPPLNSNCFPHQCSTFASLFSRTDSEIRWCL